MRRADDAGGGQILRALQTPGAAIRRVRHHRSHAGHALADRNAGLRGSGLCIGMGRHGEQTESGDGDGETHGYYLTLGTYTNNND
jgi:hypothetical protein